MEGADTYAAALAEALEKKRAQLESVVLPAMRDHFGILLSTFEGPYNILIKKGLIREDPYKLEDKLSEIRIPSRDRFAQTELNEQMGIRLSQYHTQLDFLINYYEFGVAFMTLPRLKQLTGLAKYLDFPNLAETSPNASTAGLAALLERVTRGSDSVAVGIVKDAKAHLAELTRRILKCIADVVLYQRECYKLELRTSVVPRAGLVAARVAADQNAGLAALRSAVQSAHLPFYADLATEVLAEDYPRDRSTGDELRTRVLTRLKVEEQKEARPTATGPSPRELLLEAVRALAGVEGALRSALKIVRDNEELLGRRPLTLVERIRRFLSRAAGAVEKDKSYDIEYMDESRGNPRVERIAYSAFLSEVGVQVKTLQALATKGSSAHQKLEDASDDQVFDLVTRLAADIYRVAKRFEGLGALFRSQLAPMYRSQFRSVHADLAVIRNAVSRANKQKHEYVARQEEEQQFKRLGIAPAAG